MKKSASATADKLSPYINTETIHRASVLWWWTDERLHDDTYRFRVLDSVNAAVRAAESRHQVSNNTTLRCQWEAIEFEGESPESVAAAAADVASALVRFKGIIPLGI